MIDLREMESLSWQTPILDSISDELQKEFQFERKTTNKVNFDEIIREIEALRLNFNQAPFFIFDENLTEKYAKDFLKISLFDYGLDPSFKLENDIFLPAKRQNAHGLEDESNHLQKRIKVETNTQQLSRKKNSRQNRPQLSNHAQPNTNEEIVKKEEAENSQKVKQEEQTPTKHESMKLEDAHLLQEEQFGATTEVYQCTSLTAQGRETALVLTRRIVKLEAVGPCVPQLSQVVQKMDVEAETTKNKEVHNDHLGLSASTDPSSSLAKLPWEVKLEHGASVNRQLITELDDSIFEPESKEPVICLLGQNNKALYIREQGKSEAVTLDFEFKNTTEKKNYLLKNFACCVFFDKNKVLYSGGGPSNDAYLLEFLSKTKVLVTVLPKMNQRRCWHGMVYSKPFVYILGKLLRKK